MSHRSLEDQGIDRAATIHLGPTASAIERKGERSDRGEVNHEIAGQNDKRKALPGELVATLDSKDSQSPQTTLSPAMLTAELAAYKADLQQQARQWRTDRTVLVVPDQLRVRTALLQN